MGLVLGINIIRWPRLLSVFFNPPFKMCLWFVQMCKKCEMCFPIQDMEPLYCDMPTCLRRDLDPHLFPRHEKSWLIDVDSPCSEECQRKDCGIFLRITHCGWSDSFQKHCLWSDDTDSFDDSQSSIDSQPPDLDVCSQVAPCVLSWTH
jgi:hypothetical protein